MSDMTKFFPLPSPETRSLRLRRRDYGSTSLQVYESTSGAGAGCFGANEATLNTLLPHRLVAAAVNRQLITGNQ